MVERNVLVSNLMSFLDAATSGIIGPSQECRIRRRHLPMSKKESIRKKGEKKVECAGTQTAIPPDENNGFTTWYRKSSQVG
jgi:hypothetical protein